MIKYTKHLSKNVRKIFLKNREILKIDVNLVERKVFFFRAKKSNE